MLHRDGTGHRTGPATPQPPASAVPPHGAGPLSLTPSERPAQWLAIRWARLSLQHLGGHSGLLQTTLNNKKKKTEKRRLVKANREQEPDCAWVEGRTTWKTCLPVLGSLDSSPKPCVSFFFLQRAAGDTHAGGTETPLGLLTLTPSSEGHDLPPTCCVTWGSDTPL